MHLLIDTDIGSDVDDALALALVLGSPERSLDGVVTVYGDSVLRAQLASRYLKLSGIDTSSIRVVAGEGPTRSGKEVWWAGHEGKLFEDLSLEQVETGGVAFLTEFAAEHPGQVDILAIGPLTNIAAALDADPGFEANVRSLIIMGGDFSKEERTPEHNFKSDVAAAQRVFESKIPIIVGGLDLTTQLRIETEDVTRIADAGNLGSTLRQEIEEWWRYNSEQWNNPHDPILALWLVEPKHFTEERATVEIDDDGRSWHQPSADGLVRILTKIDQSSAAEAIVARIVNGSSVAATR